MRRHRHGVVRRQAASIPLLLPNNLSVRQEPTEVFDCYTLR
jgi:hypothetical protein